VIVATPGPADGVEPAGCTETFQVIGQTPVVQTDLLRPELRDQAAEVLGTS
jgi:hypothetical protein